MMMNQRSIRLRSANPTFDEGLTFASYLDEAFEGLFHMILGQRAAEIVATAYTHPDHDFSYQNTIFAECEKTIVGMATGYTTEQHHCSSTQPLKQAASPHFFDQARVALLCIRLRFLGTHADGDFYLQAIATNGAYRGQGIGTVLLNAIEDRARASGATRFVLDAAAKNTGARRFYERHGMTVELKERIVPFMPRFIVQMTKPI
jgi:ribosomal protein S18 acetylase RimI-like enzyme